MSSTWPSPTPTYHHAPYADILPTQEHLNCRGLTLLVSGPGTGIGQAIAIAFAQAQAKGVVLLGRTKSTLEETAVKVRDASHGKTEAITVVADITNAESVQQALSTAQNHFTSIDILVNNAGGLAAKGSVADIDLVGFWKTYELNVLGPMTITQAFIKAAKTEDAAKTRTIINVSSGAAHTPPRPTIVAYSSAKLATAKIMEFVHQEHKDWRVFNLQPGVVATGLAGQHQTQGEDVAELPAAMAVWLARDPRALVLNGRFVWSNWDVNELLAMKDEIEEKDKFMLSLKGWAEDYNTDALLARVAAIRDHSPNNRLYRAHAYKQITQSQ